MKDQSERGGTRTTLRCVGGGELIDPSLTIFSFSHHVTIVTSLTNDLSPEYVDCVEVCYNEIEMEKANGQELEGLRVRIKGDSPPLHLRALNPSPQILHF